MNNACRHCTILRNKVVGYQTITLNKGFTVMSGTFLGLNEGETLDIQSLVLTGDNVTPGADNIQLLNDQSVSYVTYNWTDADNSPLWLPVDPNNEDGEWYGVPGWINEAGDALLDWDMPAAQGFVIYSENGGVDLTVSGQVKESNKVYETVGGFVVLGNFNPTSLNIQNITLTGDNVTPGTDNIQLLNDQSVSYAAYNWTDADNSPLWLPVDPDNEDGEWYGVPGWINEAGDALLDWDMPAGQGFVLFTQNAGVTVTIPSYKNATK